MTSAPSFAQWLQPQVLCRVSDNRITEASGIALSRRNPGVFYVHNDSGDISRFFALGKDGKTKGVFNLVKSRAVDFEDIAVARDAKGAPVVYLADIGDNLRKRGSVCIYAVPEPLVSRNANTSAPVSARYIPFKYPDGPHDAETLLVEPRSSALYVVTKAAAGERSGVYRIQPAARGLQTAERVGEVRFEDPLPLYPNMATGGDISPDGRYAAVRTYQAVYEWTIPPGKTFADALQSKPVMTMLMMEQQGEGICYGANSSTLLTVSEGNPSPIMQYKRKAVTTR